MEALFRGFGVAIIGTVIGLAIALPLLAIRRKLDRRNQPTAPDRHDLLRQLHEMKHRNESFASRMEFLRNRGLRRGVAEGLIVDSERKQKADVGSTSSAERSDYFFRYPGNWKLRSLDPSLDDQRFFCIESLCSAMVTVTILDDAGEQMPDLAQLLKQTTKRFQAVSQTPLTMWGSFSGEGAAYSAEMHGLPVFGKVFRCLEAAGCFYISTVCLEEDRSDAEPGLALVESSFARGASTKSSGPA